MAGTSATNNKKAFIDKIQVKSGQNLEINESINIPSGKSFMIDEVPIGSGLPSGTQGDIIYYDGADWVVLNAGTAGQFLKTGGAGADPSWDAASGGTFYLGANTVVVDEAATPVVGKIYDNYADALLYINTSGGVLGPDNMWTIFINGTLTEAAITQNQYINIQGNYNNTIIESIITSDIIPSSDEEHTFIRGCSLVGAISGTSVHLEDCVLGVLGTSCDMEAQTVYCKDCSIILINTASSETVEFDSCRLEGSTSSYLSATSNCTFRNMNMSEGVYEVDNGNFINCSIEIDGVDRIFYGLENNVYFDFCTFTADWVLTSGEVYVLYLNNCIGALDYGSEVAIDGSSLGIGNLTAVVNSCSNINITSPSSLTVVGDYYDNTTSGLTATNVQAAIDELASGSSGTVSFTDTFNATTDWTDDGSTYSITFTHSLNTYDHVTSVKEGSGPYEIVYPDISDTDVDNTRITVSKSPDERFAGKIVIIQA